MTLETYLNYLRKSKLIPESRLPGLVKKFVQGKPRSEVNLPSFSKYLIDQKLLTPWQHQKLLEGRHQGFFLDKYRILGLIGSGGMSSVYVAQHTLMDRKVAIKVLSQSKVNDSSYLGRFYAESRVTASLNHPNIIRAYDVGNESGTHYIVMEYVQGEDLQHRVERDGPLELLPAVNFIRQAAEGLAYAHRRNLVHRDIKPANLFVCQPGDQVKVLDLGLARITTDKTSLTRLHNENMLGTTDYQAPEQALDSHTVNHLADVYGLGCTFYFLLSGHPPFPEGSIAQRLMQHQTGKAKELTDIRPDIPPAIATLCHRMMEKKPQHRISSTEEVSKLLSLWLREKGFRFRSHLEKPAKRKETQKPTPTQEVTPPPEVAEEPNREPLMQFLDSLEAAQVSSDRTRIRRMRKSSQLDTSKTLISGKKDSQRKAAEEENTIFDEEPSQMGAAPTKISPDSSLKPTPVTSKDEEE
ncbi:Serine/threonine protein kinase [Planctomycetales bacterium 10988]|nr:Serine/threonine protein kinase [Planctomycetales bacterium 10988]